MTGTLLLAVSLLFFLCIAFRSKNPAWPAFAFVYSLYSAPFLFGAVNHDYFDRSLEMVVPLSLQLWVTVLTFVLSVFCLLESLVPKIKYTGFPSWESSERYVARILIALGAVALASDISFWGADLLLSQTAEKWARNASNKNLFFISIDSIIVLMSGFYVFFTKHNREGRLILACADLLLLTFFAIAGLFIGHRYYVAVIFLLWLIRPAMNSNSQLRRLCVAIALSPAIFLIAANIKIPYGYFLYHEYVSEKGFLAYFFENFSWFPAEIKAIALNSIVGFKETASSFPGIHYYMIEAFPFSGRLFSFPGVDAYYGQIARIADLSLNPGQGTAFSFFIESYDSVFFVPAFLWLVFLLWRLFPINVVGFLLMFFSLNVIRNGFLVAISAIKIPLILIAISLVLVWLARGASLFVRRGPLKSVVFKV